MSKDKQNLIVKPVVYFVVIASILAVPAGFLAKYITDEANKGFSDPSTFLAGRDNSQNGVATQDDLNGTSSGWVIDLLEDIDTSENADVQSSAGYAPSGFERPTTFISSVDEWETDGKKPRIDYSVDDMGVYYIEEEYVTLTGYEMPNDLGNYINEYAGIYWMNYEIAIPKSETTALIETFGSNILDLKSGTTEDTRRLAVALSGIAYGNNVMQFPVKAYDKDLNLLSEFVYEHKFIEPSDIDQQTDFSDKYIRFAVVKYIEVPKGTKFVDFNNSLENEFDSLDDIKKYIRN